jgi:two-component sensor histidine kinase
LTSNVLATFGGIRAIEISLDVAPLSLEVAQAMPCGLIVNELLTNSLKHAFPADFQGQPVIHVHLQTNGQSCVLTVADNGVGMPPGYDWRAGRTTGLRLVNLWATHQLGGTLDVGEGTGTSYTAKFSVTGLMQ